MTSSRALWSALQGVLCVYKPAEMSITSLKKILVRRIVAEANEVVGVREPRQITLPIVDEHPETGALMVVGEKKQIDYSEHPLVVGEMLRADDVRIEELTYMEATTSGVCLLGVNDGCNSLDAIMEHGWSNEYRVEGILGRQTKSNEMKSRVTLKADFDHISKHKMQKLLAKVQSHYRRAAFETSEVDLQSEEAFEMARKGIPRTKLQGAQIFHRLTVDFFRVPYFALGVSCVGETDQFLRNFVNEVGISLGSTASPVRLIRRGLGPFRPEHALLEKQITLQSVVRNIALCRRILAQQQNADANVVDVGNNSSNMELERHVIDALGMSPKNEDGNEETADAFRPAWPRNYRKL